MRSTRRARRGGGYMQSQQYFNPDVLGPSGGYAPSTAPTMDAIRPVLYKTGGSRRQRGGVKLVPELTGGFASIGPLPPVPYAYGQLKLTTGGGKRKNTRRAMRSARRGGFVPSVMGGFIPNAQAMIVPAALYAGYHLFVPKKGSRKSK